MAMPRGRRSSEPTPEPSASGSAPRIAAMVVIKNRTEAEEAGLIDGVLR